MDMDRATELQEVIAFWKKRGMKPKVGRKMTNLQSGGPREWRLDIPDTYWLMRETRAENTILEIEITRAEAEQFLAEGLPYNLGSVAMDYDVHGEFPAR